MFHGKGMVILRRELSLPNEEVFLVEGKYELALKDEQNMECSKIKGFLSDEHKEMKVRKCRESRSGEQLRPPRVGETSERCHQTWGPDWWKLMTQTRHVDKQEM